MGLWLNFSFYSGINSKIPYKQHLLWSSMPKSVCLFSVFLIWVRSVRAFFCCVHCNVFSIPRGGLTKRRPLECVYGMNEWMNYRTIKELLTSSSLIFLTSIKKLSLRLVSWFPLYSFFYFIFFNFIVLVLPYINIRHRYTLRPMDRSTKQKINKETQTLNNTIDQLDLFPLYSLFFLRDWGNTRIPTDYFILWNSLLPMSQGRKG